MWKNIQFLWDDKDILFQKPLVWLVGEFKEEEDDDADDVDLSFPVTANKWAAILSVIVYVVFVTAFFLVVTIERITSIQRGHTS